MAISLSKGGNISLAKEAPGMSNVLVGLGWDPRATDGAEFDLDASVFMLNASGKARQDSDFIFYGHPASPCGAVVHQGDNRTGEGEGDDEQVIVKLNDVPADVDKLAIVVTIHDADRRGQSFGQVGNAYIRIVDNDSGTEVARYDLSEDASMETAMVFGELYRHDGSWKFKAVGQGYSGGLAAAAATYGLNAS